MSFVWRLVISLNGTGLLASCGHQAIVDHEFCSDIGSQGAICFHTLTEASRDIPKDQWDDERFGQICEKSDVFADWKSVIEKLCSVSKDCDYPGIEAFFKRVDKIKQTILERR